MDPESNFQKLLFDLLGNNDKDRKNNARQIISLLGQKINIDELFNNKGQNRNQHQLTDLFILLIDYLCEHEELPEPLSENTDFFTDSVIPSFIDEVLNKHVLGKSEVTAKSHLTSFIQWYLRHDKIQLAWKVAKILNFENKPMAGYFIKNESISIIAYIINEKKKNNNKLEMFELFFQIQIMTINQVYQELNQNVQTNLIETNNNFLLEFLATDLKNIDVAGLEHFISIVNMLPEILY